MYVTATITNQNILLQKKYKKKPVDVTSQKYTIDSTKKYLLLFYMI